MEKVLSVVKVDNMLLKELGSIIKPNKWKTHLREPLTNGIYKSGLMDELINDYVYMNDEIIAIIPKIKTKELNVYVDHYNIKK